MGPSERLNNCLYIFLYPQKKKSMISLTHNVFPLSQNNLNKFKPYIFIFYSLRLIYILWRRVFSWFYSQLPEFFFWSAVVGIPSTLVPQRILTSLILIRHSSREFRDSRWFKSHPWLLHLGTYIGLFLSVSISTFCFTTVFFVLRPL